MIRVAFVLGHGAQGWLGGLNYFRNLLHAIRLLPSPQIEPVLVIPPSTPKSVLAGFPPVEILSTRLLERPGRAARRLTKRILLRDVLLERFLCAQRIDVLSHARSLGVRSSIRQAGWIEDFQHLRMPELFDASERTIRDREFRGIADHSNIVLVSSADARGDLERFAPSALDKCRILHFTAGSGQAPEPVALPELRRRFGFNGDYFHLPNQFWVHKNHRVVVDALAILGDRGRAPLVICTGSTRDPRAPEHFAELLEHAKAVGVADAFKVLGVVPYADLLALMQHSVAIINPSKFEGWSTTVEEAKSFGKKVILSDLAVHREQAPERAVFFAPDDAPALANALREIMSAYSAAEDVCYRTAARSALPTRLLAFGLRYQDIIMEVGETVADQQPSSNQK